VKFRSAVAVSSHLFLAYRALPVGLALCVACAVPNYPSSEDGGELLPVGSRDAGSSRPDAADASPPMTSPDAANAISDDASTAVEDAAAALADAALSTTPEAFPLGQYAVLTRFYGTSAATGGGWFGEEALALAEVRRAGNGLSMTLQTCAYRGRLVVPLFPLIDYTVLKPETFPARTLQLVIRGNTFSTLGEPSLIGYQELTDCPAGSTQSHPDRPWLASGRCSCPSSNLPPTSPSDCRVIDSDSDNEPGVTVQFNGGAENFAHSRMRDSSQLMFGVIAPDGHHSAQFAANFDNYQLSCAREPCSRGSAQVCPIAQNPVRFLPLEARAWTCSEVVSAVDNSSQLGLGAITSPGC